jgi:hypothetical protein
VTLFLGEQRTIRVRRQVPGEGSPFCAGVGALLGFCAGAWVVTGGLAAVDTLETGTDPGVETAPLLIAITGAVLGAAALGRGRWKTVPIPGDDRVSLALTPTRGGAAAGLSLSF